MKNMLSLAQIIKELDILLRQINPDMVVVHGDTSTAMAAAICAFHLKIPISHVEAGLRTYNLESPFPEEFNRQLTTRIAKLHFAPTQNARQNLLNEQIADSKIYVTGNTVIDALLLMVERARLTNFPDVTLASMPFLQRKESRISRIILVTGHRRENFGQGFEDICKALRDIAIKNPDVQIVYPVHLNPNVREPVNRILSNIIKAPVKSVIWYSKGINHNGSHFINLMEYWFGKCIDIKLINKGREFKDFGFEPQVYIKFENAESTLIPAWEEFYSHYTIEIISASGRLYWNQNTLEWKGLDSSNSMDNHVFLSDISEAIFTGSNKYQKYVADELYSAMMGRPNSISSGEEALETLETLDRILSLK